MHFASFFTLFMYYGDVILVLIVITNMKAAKIRTCFLQVQVVAEQSLSSQYETVFHFYFGISLIMNSSSISFNIVFHQAVLTQESDACSQDCGCSDFVVARCHDPPSVENIHTTDIHECKQTCDVK